MKYLTILVLLSACAPGWEDRFAQGWNQGLANRRVAPAQPVYYPDNRQIQTSCSRSGNDVICNSRKSGLDPNIILQTR